MRKIYNAEPLEFEIENLSGETRTVAAVGVSAEQYQTMQDIAEENADKPFDVLKKQMAIIFGGCDSDYCNYDLRVLRGVLSEVNTEMRNPINPRE
jgi:hypothetical protein